MSAQRHLIRRQVLELEVPAAASAWPLQTALGRLQREQIEAIIERCCTEAGAPGRIHRIESLEVNLGRLDPDHVERDLVARLAPSLRAALALRIREDDEERARLGGDPEADAQLELVACFARNGHLPWWADPSRPRVLDDALDVLLRRAAPALVALVRALAHEREPLLRIVRHAADERLAALLAAMVTAARLELPGGPAALTALLHAHPAAPQMGPARFRAAVWMGVLQAASIESDSAGGSTGFWREAMVRVAREASVAYEVLVQRLHEIVETERAGTPAALGEAVRGLAREVRGGPAGVRDDDKVLARAGGDPETDSRLELVAHFARNGHLPSGVDPHIARTGHLPSGMDPSRPHILDEALELLLRRAPSSLGTLVRVLAREREPLLRIILHAADERLSALLAVLVAQARIDLPGGPAVLRALLHAHGAIPQAARPRFRAAVWMGVLQAAAIENAGSAADGSTGFWRETMGRIAREAGVTYEALIHELHGVIESGRAGQAGALDQIVRSLARELRAEWPTSDLATLDEESSRTGGDLEIASRLELVARFARNGNLPPWAEPSPPRVLDDAFELLLRDATSALVALLRALARERDPLLRIVLHAADERLSALFAAMVAEARLDLPGGPAALRAMLNARGAIPQTTPAHFRVAVWMGVLQAAAIENAGSAAGGSMGFWREALGRIAHEAGVTYEALIQELHGALESGRAGEAGALDQIVRSLPREQIAELHASDLATHDEEISPTGGDLEIASRLELVADFARNGNLPSWAIPSGPRALDDALELLLRRATPALVALVRASARERAPLLRIVRHATDERLAALLAALVAEARLELPGGPAAVPALLHAHRAVPQTTPAHFRVAVWMGVLQAAAIEAVGSAAGGSMGFWREALGRIAREADVTYEALVQGLHEVVEARSAGAPAALDEVVRPLTRELQAVVHPTSEITALVPRLEDIQSPWNGILAELHEELDRQASSRDRSPQEATTTEQDGAQAPRGAPWTARDDAQAPRGASKAEEGADANAGVSVGAAPVAASATAEAPESRAYDDAPGRGPAGLGGTSAHRPGSGRQAGLPGEARVVPPDAPGPQRGASPEPAADRSQAHRAASSAAESMAALRRALLKLERADSEEAYVENAGLVVLWPFLGHLFERLELTIDKRFKDDASRARAAGLLQHLATGELEPVEYQLPLAKVLCGIEPTELVDFGLPVTEAEAEECTNLLAAAIANAPSLGKLSVAGFQGSFLIRRGVLGTRDGAWLLRVERASYDIVLDRLPWGLSWVKLPWMDTPLEVEW